MSIVVRIVIGVVVIGVLALGGWIVKNLTGDPDTAKTGDCVTNAARAEDMKIVECTDAEAAYKVIERVDNPADKGTSDDTAQAACEASADKGATDMLWQEDKSGNIDYVLCLGPTS
ncbi:LppU/SCO3897 family protein [Actinorhabdospora filicis]|nr:hypothetical protein [Actinorhabdospora filicis]